MNRVEKSSENIDSKRLSKDSRWWAAYRLNVIMRSNSKTIPKNSNLSYKYLTTVLLFSNFFVLHRPS